MATLGETTRPGFVYDSATDTWIPVGIGPHSHTPAAIGAISSSVVTTKGDLIVATGSGTVVRQGVGADGSVLVADSSQADGVSYAGPLFTAGKNKIINGDFGVWQRGTSFNLSHSVNTFTSDRWRVNSQYTSGTSTLTRQAFTPGNAIAGYEPQYYMRYTAASGTCSYVDFFEPVEDVQTFAGQTVTFSFWGKASVSTGVNSFFQQNFGSGGSSPVNTAGPIAFLTTSWARYTFTATIPSISGKTTGAGSNLLTGFYVGSHASNQTIDLWGFQLEAGSVATPFQTATGTVQGELAACQRYYQKSYDTGTNPASVSVLNGIVVCAPSLSAVGSGLSFGHVPLKVDMRIPPNVTIYSFAGTAGVVSSGQPADLAANSGGVNTAGTRSFSMINNSGGSITPVNGSFIFHYVASAEL